MATKTTPSKESEKKTADKPTTSKESKKKTADDMAFKNSAITAINSLVSQNKKLHEAVEDSKKTKKKITRPEAAKIQGLQTLKNTLGTQKTS